jgi:hypothetical protein
VAQAARKTVTLEDIPGKAVELEEYVAALFQASKHFVEKQVVEREPKAEILELDAVATSYETGSPESVLVEAKSGDWGFADAFKVRGWMQYLGIPKGALFASKELPTKDAAFFAGKCSTFDVKFVHLGDFKESIERFEAAGYPKVSDPFCVELWRLSYWAERETIAGLRLHAKTNPTLKGSAAALEYLHLVNNGIFFTPDIRKRLRELYEAYQSHPKLALGAGDAEWPLPVARGSEHGTENAGRTGTKPMRSVEMGAVFACIPGSATGGAMSLV